MMSQFVRDDIGLSKITGSAKVVFQLIVYFTRARIALLRKAESVRLTTSLKLSDAWSVFRLSTEQWRF
jgi:Ni/Fe-hydrogenase subunit HybB-like protein